MQGSNLYVGNLDYSITSSMLEEAFSKYGEVKEAKVIEGKGFGFVEMTDTDGAEKAQEALNGSDLEGRTIKVDEARPRRENSNRGGGGYRGGQRGGGGYSRY